MNYHKQEVLHMITYSNTWHRMETTKQKPPQDYVHMIVA